ncbi:heavy metal-associated isoprenylated plant protein 26-like [Hibiscus syriacus]|uniref:Heavy metal-associated isoprenylated plant protein 26-like n=2 Tax=Hibiscus syriacus TaxID=106335 RepID=A0A6A3D7C0_HIBSY|nr:heavy metal-associated isoprenylated plant protein 26-like [Hibiscus syriacus]
MVKTTARSSAICVFMILLLVGALISTHLLDTTTLVGGLAQIPSLSSKTRAESPKEPRQQIEIPLNCSAYEFTRSCPRHYPTTAEFDDPDGGVNVTCPEYFRWIHEDLRPWAYTGITRDMVERARATANFRLIIVNGTAYVEKYHRSFQTRDVFTLWGILQLLRKYPGKIPDLDLMFDCVDWPVIKSVDYGGPNATPPPPLFRYCKDDETLDIVFPDWSFWGWPEIRIKSWVPLLNDLMEGNQRTKWDEREPHAFWKGNPAVAETRQDLLKCNVSDTQDWGARVYAQDWGMVSRHGYKTSNLADQCIHRFKIYVEGSAWSVSEKYILACDSPTLLVKPRYFDFFTRGLKPLHHYWPIKSDDKCRSIKYAVDWGNTHPEEAKAMGKAASEFIKEDLKIDYVYDYMFHLLNEYGKLMRYKPTVPVKAVEFCSESMACPANGRKKDYMIESMVKGPSVTSPCTMPPPYDPASIHALLTEKEKSIKQVDEWEKKFYEHLR